MLVLGLIVYGGGIVISWLALPSDFALSFTILGAFLGLISIISGHLTERSVRRQIQEWRRENKEANERVERQIHEWRKEGKEANERVERLIAEMHRSTMEAISKISGRA